jgi:hypothetical protein
MSLSVTFTHPPPTSKQSPASVQGLEVQDLLDPGLGTAVSPALSAEQWTNAKDVLLHLADLADEALEATDCMAAVKWREILGQNDRGQVFPLPPGCDANGFPISAIASVAGTGSNEARKFG